MVGQGQSSKTSNDGSGNSQSASGIAGSGNSAQSSKTSTTTSNDGSGNSKVSVDTSDRSTTNNSYVSKTLFIPAVVPSSPAATLGVGNVTAIVGVCGPLQQVVRTPIEGTYVGLVKKSKIQQGFDESLAPYVKDGVQLDYRTITLPNGSVRYMGHQPIYFTTVVGVAAARNLALGGGNSEGSWGQAGGGSSSSMQQLVTRIQLRDCEIPTEATQTKFVERKRIGE